MSVTRDWAETYLVVLVLGFHAIAAFLVCDNLTRVLHDDLVRRKATVGADAIATVCRLDDLNTNAVLSTARLSLLKIGKGAVRAVFAPNVAVLLVTLVEHNSVLTALATAIVGCANALGLVQEMRCLLPVDDGIADETVYQKLV